MDDRHYNLSEHHTSPSITAVPAPRTNQSTRYHLPTTLNDATRRLLSCWPVAAIWRFTRILAARLAAQGSPAAPHRIPDAPFRVADLPPAYEEYPIPPPLYNESDREAEEAP